jgi:hypothetical protein
MINLIIKYLIGKPKIKNFKSNQSNESKKIYIEMMPYFYYL